MIFYFSGTGNSMYAASRLQNEESLLDIAECVNSNRFRFELQKGEHAGFICPVYFYGLPTIVSYFLSKLELKAEDSTYIYALFTCGASIGGADQMLEAKLKKQGLHLDAVYSVKMPDNYVIMFDVPKDEEQKNILAAAENTLEETLQNILQEKKLPKRSGIKGTIGTAAAYPFYKNGRKTRKFYVDNRCVGCGMCAKRCPAHAIEMRDGTPVWVKDRCIHCLGCTNRCSAIQYGKQTEKRGRYVHPILKKKTHDSAK